MQKQQFLTLHMQYGLMSDQDKMKEYNFFFFLDAVTGSWKN